VIGNLNDGNATLIDEESKKGGSGVAFSNFFIKSCVFNTEPCAYFDNWFFFVAKYPVVFDKFGPVPLPHVTIALHF